MVRATIRVVGVLFIMAIQWATADHDGDMLGRIAEPWPTPEHDQCSVWILDAADGRVTECLSSVLNLATTGAGQIALEYVPPLAAGNTAVTVGSVKFELIHANSGAVQRRIENQAPYMLLGDVQSKGMRVYFPWTPALGNHWLTVTEHTGRQGRGEVQRRLQAAFTVVDSLDPTTQQPTPSRSLSPATAGPTAPPTLHLSPPSPTPTPTQFPTPSPTPVPTPNPTPTPTRAPTLSPTRMPSVAPVLTRTPTLSPTPSPTPTPTQFPTPSPTPVPTPNPTPTPTRAPTLSPTRMPSVVPTPVPTRTPTMSPSPSPTPTPTQFPTPSPTPVPTPNPTPTPTRAPTLSPTRMPSVVPTPVPTRTPTLSPKTPTPTQFPTPSPTPVPTPNPTPTPTRAPNLSPTRMPSVVPTPVPTRTPTLSPSPTPSSSPTPSPTPVSTLNLTQAPIPAPTPTPTPYPSPVPTLVPNSYSAPPIAEWRYGPEVPSLLDEVASVIVNRHLYVFGGHNCTSFVFDITSSIWSTVRQRAWCGDHSGIVTIAGQIYLVGGFNAGQGRVQRYDPDTDSWTVDERRIPSGADGAICTTAIGGKIIGCGGLGKLGGGRTSNNPTACYSWDPDAGGGWVELAPMLVGVDHAATGTDGVHMYVFGGRATGRNVPSDGIARVQVYDSASNNWRDGAGMPLGRGGTGKAVYVGGQFYIMGGEASSGVVFDQVQLYDSSRDTWSTGQSLPQAVHGISPAADPLTDDIYVASGGTRAGYSQSKLLQVLSTDEAPTSSPSTLAPTTLRLTPAPVTGNVAGYTYELLGGGGCCRGAGGNTGEHIEHADVTELAACANLCSAEANCKGYELTQHGGCEVHLDEITYVTANLACMCFLRHGDVAPTEPVTVDPTPSPAVGPVPLTLAPAEAPTRAPAEVPTRVPTEAPTHAPTAAPTRALAGTPTAVRAGEPTAAPTECDVDVVNADNGQAVGCLSDLVSIAVIGSSSMSLRYIGAAEGFRGSVRFMLTANAAAGADPLIIINHRENVPPYALRGDRTTRTGTTYKPWEAIPGTYTLTVQVWNALNGNGELIKTLELGFAVSLPTPPSAVPTSSSTLPPTPARSTAAPSSSHPSTRSTAMPTSPRLSPSADPTLSPTHPMPLTDGPAPPFPISGSEHLTVSGELKRYHKVTIDLIGPSASETGSPNAFLDFSFEVSFRHAETGDSVIVPGFFAADGDAAETGATAGNIWRVHFCPHLTGVWVAVVGFTTGDDAAIFGGGQRHQTYDGEFTSVLVTETDKQGRDHRSKGMLRYTGDRYLQFDNGEHFVKAGADSPENLLGYEDFDGTSSSGRRRLHAYQPHVDDWTDGDPTWKGGKGKGLIGGLNYLASKGMNVISFLTFNVGGDAKDTWPFVSSLDSLHFDVSKLAQWEIVFEHADKLGIFLHFKTQETENDGAMDSGNTGQERRLYYRELVARFSHHHALNWNLGEENTQSTQQHHAMGNYFHEIDPYNHPVVIHTYPHHHNRVYGPLLGSDDLDGASIQTDWANVHSSVKQWVEASTAAGKNWVVSNDEVGAANDGIYPDDDFPSADRQRQMVAKVIWGALMAGGTGVEAYFGYRHAHNDLNCEDWRSRDAWWGYCSTAIEFFRRIPFWSMNSEDGLVGGDDYCFAERGETYIVYHQPAVRTATVLDLGHTAEGEYRVQWLDSLTTAGDDRLLTGTVFSVQGGSAVNYGNPPGGADPEYWAVLLQRVPEIGNGSSPHTAHVKRALTDPSASTAEGALADPSASTAGDSGTMADGESSTKSRLPITVVKAAAVTAALVTAVVAMRRRAAPRISMWDVAEMWDDGAV